MLRVKILVTGVGGAAVGKQVLTALRLAQESYELVIADASPHSLALAAVEPAYLVPGAHQPGYFDEIARICRRERVNVLIPGSEPELNALIAHRDRFSDLGVLLLANDRRVVDLCVDKMQTARFLAAHGFAAPKSLLVTKQEEIAAPAEFPLIIKPARDSRGSRNVFIVQEEDELRFFVSYLLRSADAVLIQEYVSVPTQEYTVGVLSTLSGELVGSIALRRFIADALSTRLVVPNRTGRRDLGENLAVSSGFSHGEIADFSSVRRQCEEIAVALGSRGPLNIQCRLVDGLVVPFEINPRFSGTTSIRAMMGFNEPDILIRHHLLGKELSRPTYKAGVVLRSVEENCIAAQAKEARGAWEANAAEVAAVCLLRDGRRLQVQSSG